MHGLEAGDFLLEIDGIERPVAVATEVDLDGPSVDRRMRAETSSEVEGRSFVLSLDTVFQRPQNLDVCIHAAHDLLAYRRLPGDPPRVKVGARCVAAACACAHRRARHCRRARRCAATCSGGW